MNGIKWYSDTPRGASFSIQVYEWLLGEPFSGLCAHSIHLTSKSVKGASLALEGIDNVHGCNSFPLSVLSVGDRVTDHVLQEHFQDATCLFVDQTRDSLNTTSASKTADSWLGDTLDVITKNLSVTLGASLSQSFASFTTSRHDFS